MKKQAGKLKKNLSTTNTRKRDLLNQKRKVNVLHLPYFQRKNNNKG